MEDNLTPAGSMDRRNMLKVAASAVGAGMMSPIVGTADDDKPRGPFIEAYADQLSCLPGEKVGLCVSTSANSYAIEVARVGAKREIVYERSGIPGAQHEAPPDSSSNGCRWPVALKIPVSDDWRSGYYQVLLRSHDDATRGEAFFVVRSGTPGRDARILLQLCTNTYNAYNQWGGTSLYGGPAGGTHRVSFERPYIGFEPADNFTNKFSGWRRWEQPFVEWAEAAGYALDFAVNLDLDLHPELLRHYRLVASVGHDEYWTAGMRDNLEKFIASGGNVAFFSGNTCFWQVRQEDDGRALVSWKSNFHQDPVYATKDHRQLTGTWSNRLIGRPENQLTGVAFTYGGYHRFFEYGGDGCYTIHRPDHWILAGAGLKRGDRLGEKDKIVGYECDGCQFKIEDGLPVPTRADGTPEDFVILGTAPAWLGGEISYISEGLYGLGTTQRVPQPGAAVMGAFTRGGTVFTTGCTEWVRGLQGHDPQVERITRNVLDRLANDA